VDKYRLTLPSAKIRDPGGNALDGEFNGTFPTGNGSAGGDFSVTFEVLHVPEFPVTTLPFRGFQLDSVDYSTFSRQSGSSPTTIADVNGDGLPDLLRTVYATGSDTNDYHVLNMVLQNPDHTFTNAVSFPVPAFPIRVLTGDVDGDHKTDVLIVHYDGSFNGLTSTAKPFQLSLLIGNGDGTFQPARAVNTGGRLLYAEGTFVPGNFTGHQGVDLMQFIPDLAQRDFQTGDITNMIPGQVLVYPNLAGSLGTPISTPLVSTNQSQTTYDFVGAADLNHDGKLDLVLPASGFRVPALVLLSKGDGTFTSRTEPQLQNADSPPFLADFTGDGEIDLIVGNRFLRGTGDGGFTLVNNEGLKRNGVQEYDYFTGSRIADFNHDGRLDYLVSFYTTNFIQSLGIFTNKADGTFGLMATVPLSPDLLRVPVNAIDLNQDGFVDLVFEGGDGSDVPFLAYALFGQSDGLFPSLPQIMDAEKIGLLDTPLLADLNNDGAPDVIGYFVNGNPEPKIAVMPTVPGGFGLLITNAIGTTDPSFFVRALGAGDVNGDGKIDVIASEFNSAFGFGQGAVYLLLGNGDGTLQIGKLLSGASNLLAVADFNGDGRADLLSYDNPPNSNTVLAMRAGKTDGTFASPVISTNSRGFQSGQPLIGDFNNDGKLDFFIGGQSANSGIWLNDGTGHFTPTGLLIDPANRWEVQGLGDFNHDGKLDVLFNDRTGDIPTYKLIVLPGDGTGKLGSPLLATPFPGTYNSKAVVADVNGDGFPDVITPGRFPNPLQEARVSLGNGDGTFQPPISYFGLYGSNSMVTAADFNNDGLIDLLVGRSLLLQRPSGNP
jgi:hypothetical protein